jgi:hypothetical protein
MTTFNTDPKILKSYRKKWKERATKDSLDQEIKRLDVAAQTPFEKSKRRRRIWQSKKHS